MARIQPVHTTRIHLILEYDRRFTGTSATGKELELGSAYYRVEGKAMVPLNQGFPSLDRLRLAVLEQNRPGSVEGLLAHHVLKDDPRINIEWQVACTQEWISAEFKPTNLDHVAALGCFLWAQPNSRFTPRLLDGLERVRERDAFKGAHLSVARNPTRLYLESFWDASLWATLHQKRYRGARTHWKQCVKSNLSRLTR